MKDDVQTFERANVLMCGIRKVARGVLAMLALQGRGALPFCNLQSKICNLKSANGFSMIEVLVASTIMIVIMLMLGMLFQQTSQAWRTGRQRAEVLIKARALFGVLQRDVGAAVDMNTLPQAVRDQLGGRNQNFSGNIQFFTLSGDGFENDSPPGNNTSAYRALMHVKYDRDAETGGYTRRATAFLPSSSGGLQAYEPDPMQILTKSYGGAELQNVAFLPYFHSGQLGGANAFPAFLTISTEATARQKTLEIGAGSAGPDRQWDTGDDIKTWTESQ